MRFKSMVFVVAAVVALAGCASTSSRHSDRGGTGGCVTKEGDAACETLQGECHGSYNEWDKEGRKTCECCGEKQENPKYHY